MFLTLSSSATPRTPAQALWTRNAACGDWRPHGMQFKAAATPPPLGPQPVIGVKYSIRVNRREVESGELPAFGVPPTALTGYSATEWGSLFSWASGTAQFQLRASGTAHVSWPLAVLLSDARQSGEPAAAAEQLTLCRSPAGLHRRKGRQRSVHHPGLGRLPADAHRTGQRPRRRDHRRHRCECDVGLLIACCLPNCPAALCSYVPASACIPLHCSTGPRPAAPPPYSCCGRGPAAPSGRLCPWRRPPPSPGDALGASVEPPAGLGLPTL